MADYKLSLTDAKGVVVGTGNITIPDPAPVPPPVVVPPPAPPPPPPVPTPPPVPAPVPVPVVGAPEPQAGDTVLLSDAFNATTIAAQLAKYSKAGNFSLVPGRSGNAIRVTYDANNWWSDTFDTGPLWTPQQDLYVRYWFRTSPGADPSCGQANWSGFKWFMAYRAGTLARYTNGVSMLTGGPKGFENKGMEFETHDVSSVNQPNPFCQNIDKSKRFNTTNDGNWHKYTVHIKTSAPAYEQIWIDDVKVLDSRDGQPGVPAGGYDHDANGIVGIKLPGTMVQWVAGFDWSIDIDDLAVWAGK